MNCVSHNITRASFQSIISPSRQIFGAILSVLTSLVDIEISLGFLPVYNVFIICKNYLQRSLILPFADMFRKTLKSKDARNFLSRVHHLLMKNSVLKESEFSVQYHLNDCRK